MDAMVQGQGVQANPRSLHKALSSLSPQGTSKSRRQMAHLLSRAHQTMRPPQNNPAGLKTRLLSLGAQLKRLLQVRGPAGCSSMLQCLQPGQSLSALATNRRRSASRRCSWHKKGAEHPAAAYPRQVKRVCLLTPWPDIVCLLGRFLAH